MRTGTRLNPRTLLKAAPTTIAMRQLALVSNAHIITIIMLSDIPMQLAGFTLWSATLHLINQRVTTITLQG
jgi:hypothetical protein